MLAVRTPIAGIFIAVLVLVGQVAVMRAYVEASRPAPAKEHRLHAHHSKVHVPPPKFGHRRGCADGVRISGPDDITR
ncbi:MAG TPA: hypothetical protein VMZ53_13830 [Kofleriaceae bacterium]|nr:hypothetical protein [Kofleriaceae bacterium]